MIKNFNKIKIILIIKNFSAIIYCIIYILYVIYFVLILKVSMRLVAKCCHLVVLI